MLVEINTDDLIRSDLTASQFVILNLFVEKKFSTLAQYLQKYQSREDLKDLVSKGYFMNEEEIDAFFDKGKDVSELSHNLKLIQGLFRIKDSLFWEVFTRYPITVPSGRNKAGVRVLRTMSVDSLEAKKLQKKYDAIVGKSAHKHSHILRCLEAEMWLRKRQGSLEFMQGLEVWINTHSWEKYEYLLELSNNQKVKNKEVKYGEQII